MKTIEIDGFKLGYRIEGSGTPALVIGSSLYYPKLFSTALEEHLQLIFIDHRGFTTPPPHADQSAYELDVILDDIEKIRQHLNVGPVVIVGHSGHAFMALEYAKKYPENVSHVVMIGIGPDLSPKSQELAEQSFQKLASPERKAIHEEKIKELPERIEADPDSRWISFCICHEAKSWYDPHFDSSPLWEGVTTNLPMVDYVWGEVFRDIDITKGLETLYKPVFLALGRYDFLVAPPSSWEPICNRFHNLTIEIFEKSGHNPQLEEAELFDQKLLQWLASSVK